MKQTVAISAFAGMLARQSGYTPDFCERFVIEMFKTVADALKESNDVTVKGLGKFSVNGFGDVVFEPDASFAAEVNAPFDCFEPEPLDDDVTDEILSMDDKDETEDNDKPEEQIETENVRHDTTEMTTETADNEMPAAEEDYADETADTVIEEETVVADKNPEVESAAADVADENAEADSFEYTEDTRPASSKRPIWAFVCGVAVGLIAGAAATYFIVTPRGEKETAAQVEADIQETAALLGETSRPAETDSLTTAPSIDTEETAPIIPEVEADEDSVTYDTVTSTLAQLSRKHYGSYEFWVYIYEENRDVISNPDRVEPNTRLRIPDAAKYGIDARNKESINKALKKSQEIAAESKRQK